MEGTLLIIILIWLSISIILTDTLEKKNFFAYLPFIAVWVAAVMLGFRLVYMVFEIILI